MSWKVRPNRLRKGLEKRKENRKEENDVTNTDVGKDPYRKCPNEGVHQP